MSTVGIGGLLLLKSEQLFHLLRLLLAALDLDLVFIFAILHILHLLLQVDRGTRTLEVARRGLPLHHLLQVLVIDLEQVFLTLQVLLHIGHGGLPSGFH